MGPHFAKGLQIHHNSNNLPSSHTQMPGEAQSISLRNALLIEICAHCAILTMQHAALQHPCWASWASGLSMYVVGCLDVN